jgi:hypothetical protein
MYTIFELIISVILASLGLWGIYYICDKNWQEIERYKALGNYLKAKNKGNK